MPPASIVVKPAAAPLIATIVPPGSKSITNRACLLAAMACGCSRIEGALFSDDTARMAAALTALGFTVAENQAERRIEITGAGGAIPSSEACLEAGDAGTAMRFLTGFLTLGHGRYRIDGSARMRERPVGALLDGLRELGVHIRSEREDGRPPLVIDMAAGAFTGGTVTLDARQSSQFASALLMPAPLWRDGLNIRVLGETARPFIAMTLKLMTAWGVESFEQDGWITIAGGQKYESRDFQVEPDASAASYFAAAAALLGGTVTLPGLSRTSIQGDLKVLELLEQMGARLEWRTDRVTVTGGGHLSGVDVKMNDMPDMVPTLAAIAPFAASPTRIRGVGFIRHHESDRIGAIATELRRLGAAVEEFDDGLGIAPSQLQGAEIETYNDHRIAMAFAIAGLRLAGVVIKHPECVAKTYPEFFQDLGRLAPQD